MMHAAKTEPEPETCLGSGRHTGRLDDNQMTAICKSNMSTDFV